MIKNIIFDLGGVILNIDYNLSSEAFKNLGIENFDEVYSQASQSYLFDNLETGKISADEFRNKLRDISGLQLKDDEIDSAWNKMLLDLPLYRIDILKKAANKYRTFLFSNTNVIHFESYTKDLQNTHNIKSLNHLFEKAYYSHELGMRKPDSEAFKSILKQNYLNKEETVFIDDSIQHINGAKKVGINTIFMDRSKGMELKDIFNDKGELVYGK